MSNRQGFTIVEILVAITVLSIGVLGLVGSSALVTRMISRGRYTTIAAQVAEQRIENLRRRALSTNPPCTALAAGTTTAMAQGLSETWTVAAGPQANMRLLSASVTYNAARGPRTVTLNTIIRCN